MTNIPISQIVTINPRVVSAGGEQTSLDALLVTQNTGVAPSQLLVFYDATSVSNYFGAASSEASAAAAYFPGLLNGGQQPGSVTFARFVAADAPAAVYGASTGLTLSQLQALTGTLIVTTSTTRTSSAINLAAATSFANAATLMTAAFTTPDFAITYDAQRARFVVTTTATGSAAVISAVTGTLATAVGLSDAAGAYLQSVGMAADTAATAMDRVVAAFTNWGIFTTVYAADLPTRLAFAAWTSGASFQYIYVGWDQDAASIVSGNAASFGAQLTANGYQGTIAVYGNLAIAAAVLAWAASTNFQTTEGRNALAFRQIAASLDSSAALVNTLSTANALLSNDYTYLGSYASSSNLYTVLYNGAISGQFLWADTYLGQIWLRRTLQQALFETLLAYNTLPYNTDGYNAIYQGAQGTVEQGLANGVIRRGVTLSASQAAQINVQAGKSIAEQVSSLGWYLQVEAPLSTSARTTRSSPLVNFWYCDGGSIQQITVASTTIL